MHAYPLWLTGCGVSVSINLVERGILCALIQRSEWHSSRGTRVQSSRKVAHASLRLPRSQDTALVAGAPVTSHALS